MHTATLRLLHKGVVTARKPRSAGVWIALGEAAIMMITGGSTCVIFVLVVGIHYADTVMGLGLIVQYLIKLAVMPLKAICVCLFS